MMSPAAGSFPQGSYSRSVAAPSRDNDGVIVDFEEVHRKPGLWDYEAPQETL